MSVTDLFSIGIGPSSSHTVGPMRAACAFAAFAIAEAAGRAVVRVTCTLHGSLSLTGRGHATDRAVQLGLMGWMPDAIDPDAIGALLDGLAQTRRMALGGRIGVDFEPARDVVFAPDFDPGHANTMRFAAVFDDGAGCTQTWYSVGGGEIRAADAGAADGANVAVPYPFETAGELLAQAGAAGLDIAALVAANEAARRDPAETGAFLDSVHAAMSACIDRGCRTGGELPGGLSVRRRAPSLEAALVAESGDPALAARHMMEWVSLWALAVNEENAAGGRVVTAPTNGAAGVLPAVLRFYERTTPGADRAGVHRFLLTASAIGMLYKLRASVSAAHLGCQAEVGVACSMAAGALCAVLGGSNAQVENAAEIGMEHNLGLTCDPIGGLVQIPCIERNTMGAIKAINAAWLALRGDGQHVVSLDAVIETMRQTGEDMGSRYKETSLAGLAVNVGVKVPVNIVEC
nr:L-serine ammonia-lyase [Endobacter medicaginis]